MSLNSTIRKKVFLITPSLAGGGAERIYITLARAFQKQYSDKLDVTLVALSGEGPLRDLISKDIKFVDLQSPRARQAVFKLRTLLKQEKPDAVFTFLQASIVCFISTIFLRTKTKHICKLTNHLDFTFKNMSYTTVLLFKLALSSCHKIVVMTEETGLDTAKKLNVSRDKIIKINNPIDSTKVIADSEAFVLSLERPALVACGRLSEQKGFAYAICAMSQVVETHPTAHLYILGEGEKRAELKALIAEQQLQDNVSLLGFQQNPYPYFKHADVFILSSLWEGFGNVLVEAMALGTAIISTDCPSGPREILQNGESGILVPPANSSAIARATVDILKDSLKKKELESAALNRALEFDVNIIALNYQKLI